MFGKKYLSPCSLLAALLCFLLPFCDLRCNNTTLITLKGYHFVVGRDLSKFNPLTGEEDIETPALSSSTANESIRPNPYAISAFACALLALLAWYFVRNREGDIIVLLLSFTGALMLILFRLSFGHAVSEKVESGLMRDIEFGAVFLWGYYLAILALLIAGCVTILELLKPEEPDREEMNDTPPLKE